MQESDSSIMSAHDAPAFMASIRRHFVGIAGRYLILDEEQRQVGESQNFAFSGFVITIGGVWCLMTAGHVLQSLNVLATHSLRKLDRISFWDYFNLNAKVKEPTPFAIEPAKWIHVNRDDFDAGFIPLSDFHRASLAANGIEPLPVADWQRYAVPDCDDYYLLGLPAEQIRPVTEEGTGRTGLTAVLTLVLLDASRLPAIDKDSKIPRFMARLQDEGELNSVKGMSGGPIIGVRKSEAGWEHACIAVQGSWLESTRTVYGTPVGIVVDVVEKLLAEAQAK